MTEAGRLPGRQSLHLATTGQDGRLQVTVRPLPPFHDEDRAVLDLHPDGDLPEIRDPHAATTFPYGSQNRVVQRRPSRPSVRASRRWFLSKRRSGLRLLREVGTLTCLRTAHRGMTSTTKGYN